MPDCCDNRVMVDRRYPQLGVGSESWSGLVKCTYTKHLSLSVVKEGKKKSVHNESG